MFQGLRALVIGCLLLGILAACGEAASPLYPADTMDGSLEAVTVPPTPTQSDTPTATRGMQVSGNEAADAAQHQLQSDPGATSEQDSHKDDEPSDEPTRPRTTLRDKLEAMAKQEVSEEEALWRLRWQEGLEQVVQRLESDYPDDYSRAGDIQGRYAVVGFRTRVPPRVQALLDEFSDSASRRGQGGGRRRLFRPGPGGGDKEGPLRPLLRPVRGGHIHGLRRGGDPVS